MDASALASAKFWLSVINSAKLVATFLVVVGGAIEFGGSWIARPYEKVASDAREAQLAAALSSAANANERAKALEVELEKARADTAAADAILLGEQRLTAHERMRLEHLERIVLPRLIQPDAATLMAGALRDAGFHPINIAIMSRAGEARGYGFNLLFVLQAAGMLNKTEMLPRDAEISGVWLLAVDEEGDKLAIFLQQKFQIAVNVLSRVKPGTDASKLQPDFAGVPTDRNCLIVGGNDAAYQGQPGQPGEGADARGRAAPAPQ